MSDSVEFKITSDVALFSDHAITANFEETAQWLKEMLAPYSSMVISESMVSDAKSDLAKIRKVRSRIDEVRKEAKKICMAQYLPFEQQAKELEAICDHAVSNLDGQIKSFDVQRRTKKLEEVSRYFEDEVGDLSPWLKFDDIYNEKWVNVTFSLDAVFSEIDKEIAQTRRDLEVIRDLHSEFEAALLDEYTQTHSLAAVLAKQARLNEQKRVMSERAPEKQSEAAPSSSPVSNPQKTSTVNGTVYTVDFRVRATVRQLDALKRFLQSSGISYGAI